ncbi:MAG: DNA polymerase IV [Eubacteriales bacterium]
MKRERIILHSDMNNFYASVECMLDPSLRNHAVAVCGAEEERHGIVLAKNQKAKGFGVSTGETIWQAKQKCPDLVIVPPHYEQYLKFSNLAKEIYSRHTNRVESYGMDECWLDMSGAKDGRGVAESIRQTIKSELGLTVSIGVSFNKSIAKLASDMKKPDAITVIERDTFWEKVWHLPVTDLLGVGPATAKRLHAFDIKTIGGLALLDDKLLKRWFGVNGLKLKRFANGIDNAEVRTLDNPPPIKSIGHGITASHDLQTPTEVWHLMLSLAQSIGSKLRFYQKTAYGVAISIKDNQLMTRQWQSKMDFPTQSATTIAKECFALFEKSYDWRSTVRSVSLRAIYLEEEDHPVQLDFYTDLKSQEKREKIDLAIEEIRKRYGKKAIYNACLHNQEKDTDGVEIILPTGMY